MKQAKEMGTVQRIKGVTMKIMQNGALQPIEFC